MICLKLESVQLAVVWRETQIYLWESVLIELTVSINLIWDFSIPIEQIDNTNLIFKKKII